MISFIAVHWWAWPFVYAAIGALLGGLFEITGNMTGWIGWLVFWPFFILYYIGALLRNMW